VLPKAQQVVEVVEEAAWIFLCVFLLPQGVQVKRELASPPGQHQNHQAGVKTTHVLLGEKPEKHRGIIIMEDSNETNRERRSALWSCLCEGLHIDDVNQPKKEGQPVLHSSHVGQQTALREHFNHCRGTNTKTKIDTEICQ